jgi:acetylglutamate kinase
LKVLIKLGGTLLEEPSQRANLAWQLAEVARSNPLIVVHGGGKQVTRYLEDRGVESRFVRGLRVSDEAVTKVIAGTVNQQLVSALVAAGIRAVGLSGIDGPLTIAKQLDPELGYVGQPVTTDGKLLDLLSGAGYVPAVACVAGDCDGNIYNVNADQMAVSCAAGWKADKLIFLTDVPGVKDSSGVVLHELSVNQSRQLIADGVAHGGMQAKLEAAESALKQGIPEVDIASGREPGVCRRLLSTEAVGTRLYLETA